MQRKFIYIVSIIILILLGSTIILKLSKGFPPKKVHYHAGFVVFQNNKKIDFSDNKYMYIEPCSADEKNKKEDSTTIQIEKAHLHDNVGDVVHIERTGAQWRDLFTNIHFPIDYANATGYINGKKVSNFQEQSIRPFDSLVVFIGNNDITHLQDTVTKDYIEKQAKKSITCGE